MTTSAPPRQILFIVHDATDGPGLLDDWAADRGHVVELHDIRSPAPLPDPGRYDLVVPMGSVESVADPAVAFVPPERAFLQDAIRSDVAVLGVCFGGQLLASALGAEVKPADEAEVGWYAIRSARPDIVPEGPWFSWHVDRFDLPEGADLLADGPQGPQAFRLGHHIGLQFHPEVDAAMVEHWTREGTSQLAALGVDIPQLIARSHAEDPHLRDRAYDLFDRLSTVLFP